MDIDHPPIIEEDEEKDEFINIEEENEPVEGDEYEQSDEEQSSNLPVAGEEYDTDLENEAEVEDFDVTGRNLYLTACKHYNVVPISYFLRHMQDPSLVMQNHGLSEMGVKAIALALQNNTRVINLDLECNWIEGNGGGYIAQMLKENIYITDLNLANNNLGSVGCAHICDMLTVNTTLQGLNLSGNKFKDSDSMYFVEALAENRRLQYLNLSHNYFGDKAAHILGHAVSENETLEELDISWNHFRFRGAVEMCDQIKHNAKLKIVNLSFNGLGPEGGMAVADIIKVNNVLLQLDVSYNRIPSSAAMLISKNMEHNETLKVFKIGHNPIGVEGAKTMLKGISVESNLVEVLDMSGIEVDKEFLAAKKEFQESKKKVAIIHGGTIGDYVIKGPPLSKLRILLTTPLDEIDFSTVLSTIKDHCGDKSFPIKDSIQSSDKMNENNNKMSFEDFLHVLQHSGVCLGNHEIGVLTGILKKVDSGGVDCSLFLKD